MYTSRTGWYSSVQINGSLMIQIEIDRSSDRPLDVDHLNGQRSWAPQTPMRLRSDSGFKLIRRLSTRPGARKWLTEAFWGANPDPWMYFCGSVFSLTIVN